MLHIDIIDHKLWIQNNGTEEGVAVDLVAAGIPKEHIVLDFEPLNNENIQSLQSRDTFRAIASLIFPHED
ncbi:element excision factor XisI family protein [Fischerella thermalis]|uniref:element excision factor XisI family protein n=1 Tax=Fischerella thermalis TaxID=372787 RepID=UPI0030B8F99C